MGSSLTVRRVLLLLTLGTPVAAIAQLGSLKTVTVPAVPDLERYVRDRQVLLVLGKSLFWDMQVGSDGRTACATCHFHAGADHRAQNQLSNPNGPFEPNHLMSLDDFPFRVFADSNNNLSPPLRDSGQRAGSAGIVRRSFSALAGSGPEEGIDSLDAPAFRVSGGNTRQVTPRNAPSVINAALNVRNFFDGRASDVFTGRTPFGDSDPRPNALAVSNGQLAPEMVRMTNSSLASQAVAPPVNPVEMSYEGRTWPILGRKLLPAHPLANQNVAADDSVLGAYANPGGRGLGPTYTYSSLIQAAFQPAYWDSAELVDENGFTQAEYNFSLFFGLAIQAYESTLIADDSRYDQYAEGKVDALTSRERSGLTVLETRAFCPFCHSGPELTTASFTYAARKGLIDSVLTGKPGSLEFRLSDSGFFHTGVRPSTEDPGLEALDDFGMPLSLAARSSTGRLAIDGAFKVPGLRNVELTGPYFRMAGRRLWNRWWISMPVEATSPIRRTFRSRSFRCR